MSDKKQTADDRSREQKHEASQTSERRRVPSAVLPVILITAGVLFLLSNLGYLSASAWSLIWRFWPVLLVALGVDVLIGRRSALGAVISSVFFIFLAGAILILVLLAPQIPVMTGLVRSEEITSEHIEHPLDGVEEATVVIDWSSLPAELDALTRSDNLIEGDIDYRGQLLFNVSTRDDQANVTLDEQYTGAGIVWLLDSPDQEGLRWQVGLHPDVVYDLHLNSGSGPSAFNLQELVLSYLNLDAGSGPIDLTLPGSATYRVNINGGSGPMKIRLPAGSGVRAELNSGSGNFNPGELFRVASTDADDSIWETTNYRTADYSIMFTIDQGSGSITFD